MTQNVTYKNLGRFLPCARPRFNRGNMESAVVAAARLSTHTGKSQYVYATAYGYAVTTTAPPTGQPYIYTTLADDGSVCAALVDYDMKEARIPPRGI